MVIEVKATELIKTLEIIKNRAESLSETVALACAIEAVRVLDIIQLESDPSKKEVTND